MRRKILLATLLISLGGCATPPSPPLLSPSATPSPTPAAVQPREEDPPLSRGPKQVRPAEPPMKLTSSEGVGLELVTLQAKAVVNGPLAFSELHLTFENPQDRVLEGRFEIRLPEGAALSRLAMLNENGWQEAEVVELQQARAAYEDALHRRQDPALLEKAAGNLFQARIFPIPARSKKEIILSYSQELAARQDYVLPLAGLPRMRSLEVSAQVWQGPGQPPKIVKLARQGEAPAADFTAPQASPVRGLVKDDLVMLSVRPPVQAEPAALDSLLVLVDTSASRAAGYPAEVETVRTLLTQLGRTYPKARFTVCAFDQGVVPLGDPDKAWAALQQRQPMGATDLQAALEWAAQQKGYQRVLLVTDGVTTAGGDLSSKPLKAAGIQRVDALTVGGIRDRDALQTLVGDTGGLVLDGDAPVAENADALSHQAVSGVKVAVDGALWVWPDRLDGLRPGQETQVFAQVSHPGQKATVSLSGPLQQKEEIQLTSVAWPLLERAAVGARIRRLTRDAADAQGKERDELRKQIVRLSTQFRVVSDYTALLVLEGEEDYARFGIDRKALADILVVGAEGVEVAQRKAPALPPKPPVPEKSRRLQEGGEKRNKQVSDALESPADGRPPNFADESGGYVSTPAASAGDSPATAVPQMEAAPSGRGARQVSGRVDDDAVAVGGRPVRHANVRPVPAPEPADAARRDGPMENYLAGRSRGNGGQQGAPALTGKMAEIDARIKKHEDARELALAWLRQSPGDVLALTGYGDALLAAGQPEEAARAYGSLIDLFPGRADLRRFAGSRLDAVGKAGQALAADTYARAAEQRPDHPSSHRLLAYALVRQERYREAFEAMVKGVDRTYPSGRFLGYDRILREDLSILGAVWAAAEPARKGEIEQELKKRGLRLDEQPSLRFVLTWETDANDVDFHIRDAAGGHAFYQEKRLPSGGELYADVTTGYGPECFNLPDGGKCFPYQLSIHYYSRGPMGYGMGKVEAVQHDGKGHLKFLQRPYVVMNDQAFVDLGTIDRKL